MEKLLIISHRGISSLQGLYICFRHSYTNASLPYVGFFGPVPTVGSHHAVPDLCIHIIKGRTLLFPWRPRICGGRDSVMLDRTTVIKMHGARGLFFCGVTAPLIMQCGCLCMMLTHYGSRAEGDGSHPYYVPLFTSTSLPDLGLFLWGSSRIFPTFFFYNLTTELKLKVQHSD